MELFYWALSNALLKSVEAVLKKSGGNYCSCTAANRMMRIVRVTKIIVALLIMTFVGQSVASANVSCLTQPLQSQALQSQLLQSQFLQPKSQDPMMDFALMDHAQHMDMNCSNALDSSEQCVDEGCSLGGCITAMLPASQQTFAPTFTSLISHYVLLTENQITVSLYRPPISR